MAEDVVFELVELGPGQQPAVPPAEDDGVFEEINLLPGQPPRVRPPFIAAVPPGGQPPFIPALQAVRPAFIPPVPPAFIPLVPPGGPPSDGSADRSADGSARVPTLHRIRWWWHNQTTSVKAAGSLVAFFLLLLISFGVGKLGADLSEQAPVKWDESKCTEYFCLTPECVHSANDALAQMNNSAEPCENFLNYACGMSRVDTQEMLDNRLRLLLEEENHENESASLQLAKNFYKQCMDMERRQNYGDTPLLNVLTKFGGWPVLEGDNWDVSSSWSWVKSVEHFRKEGYRTDFLIDFFVGYYAPNSSRILLFTNTPSHYIRREELFLGRISPRVAAYYNYMVDVAVLLGADRTQAIRELGEALEFERSLATISLPNEELQYNPMSMKEFQSKYSFARWVDYLNVLFTDTGIVIDENEIIVDSAPDYWEKLGPLLDETSNRTMANYVMWCAVRSSSLYLTEELRQLHLKFSAALTGEQESNPRWKECLDATTKQLPNSVAALYDKNSFDDDSRRAALDMMNEIKNEFVDILNTVDWMDNITNKSALEKVNSMVTHVVEVVDEEKLNEYYKDLKISPNDDYVNSFLASEKFATTYYFKKLRGFAQFDSLPQLNPAVVNANYSFLNNSIEYPAEIMQSQFYSYDLAKYVNYGAIGTVIGTEMAHAFEGQDWWQNVIREAHREILECFYEQVGNALNQTVFLDSARISDIMAHHGGIKVAYHAYQKWAAKNGREPQLPGLDLTPEQMFWLAAAQSRCSVLQPDAPENDIISEDNMLNKFQMLGPMINMKEFSKDFSCPSESPMNPVKKCKIW